MSHLMVAWIAACVGFLAGGAWFAMWERYDKAGGKDLGTQ